ncbi:DUF748 domain-containing protein [Pedobacter hartonius]|uniref:AsmA-like C-terminal region n=1 Tax=Pedobacter hartonius TaxID=425514 RepID=A0A1H3W0D5_9SPHI|nr:DUF748 domain-containing protein [Pedobacter hartonius]SDZ80533.1 protein of unknown function [Pedobacter hartonius]
MKKFAPQIKRYYLIIAVVVLAIFAFRLALPNIVKNYVNKKLNNLSGYTGHVDDIDIRLLQGAYVIKGLVLKKNTDPAKYPFLTIRRTDLSIEWKAIFKGRLVGEVILDHPVIHILSSENLSKEPSKESWTKTVKALMPMTINKLLITEGRFAYVDNEKKPHTNLHIDHMHLTATNLANVEKAADPLPSKVDLTGTSIGGGQLKADMKVNALKDIPDFDMGMQLRGVNLLSLNGFLEANVKFNIERGSIDIFSKLKLKNSQIDGYIKPFIKDLKVLKVKKDIKKKGGILRVVKKAVVGLFAKAVTNPKTQKIATVVPIKGNINDMKSSGWSTFLGVLKNAFIKAFRESIAGDVPG